MTKDELEDISNILPSNQLTQTKLYQDLDLANLRRNFLSNLLKIPLQSSSRRLDYNHRLCLVLCTITHKNSGKVYKAFKENDDRLH